MSNDYFTIQTLTKEYLKKNRVIIFFVFLTSLFILIKGIVFPRYLGRLLPAIQNNAKDVYYLMIITVTTYIVFNVGIAIHEYLKMILKQKTQPFYINYFSQHVLDNLEQEFIKTPESVLYNNIILYADREDWYYDNIIRGVLPLAVILIGINSYLYYFDFWSGFIFTITILVYLSFFLNIQKKVVRDSKIMTCEKDNIIKYSEDINKNIDSILSLEKIDKEKQNISAICKNYGEKLWNWMNLDYTSRHITVGIFTIGVFIILHRLYNLWNIGKCSSETLITYIGIAFYFMNGELPRCAERIQSITQQYGQKQNYLNKINQYIQTTTQNTSNKNMGMCETCVLSINNIKYFYQPGKNLFFNFNLNFYKGDVVGLIGQNGSGKSTLLKLIFGIKRIQEGSINIENSDITQKNIRQWRQYIHYCSQNPKLFNRTVYDNIYYGNKNKALVDNLMKKLELTDILLPIRDRVVGLGGEKLSGGQRQIIALFRLIANYKPIVLLDEPTSALDSKSTKIVYKMLDYLKSKNTTIILVTHDPEVLKRCNRTIKLSNGKIIEDSKTYDS